MRQDYAAEECAAELEADAWAEWMKTEEAH
jgi:hypothetical protein